MLSLLCLFAGIKTDQHPPVLLLRNRCFLPERFHLVTLLQLLEIPSNRPSAHSDAARDILIFRIDDNLVCLRFPSMLFIIADKIKPYPVDPLKIIENTVISGTLVQVIRQESGPCTSSMPPVTPCPFPLSHVNGLFPVLP